MNEKARAIVEALRLTRHPEGGFYRRTWESGVTLPAEALPARFAEPRLLGTAILFLLEGSDFSALHRLKSDELWHYHDGAGAELTVIHPEGRLETVRLGRRVEAGETPQHAIPAGTWFGGRVLVPGSYVLLGCTVHPGFDFADFELARRDLLTAEFPEHRVPIERLTRCPLEVTP